MRLSTFLAAATVVAFLGCSSETASTQTPSPAVRADLGSGPTTVTGTIESYTRTPAGEPDGFVLASGQRVHIPPALGAQALDRFPPNTSVKVIGRLGTDADGRQVVEADQLSSPSSSATLDIAALRGSPSVPAAPGVGGSGPVDPQRPMSTPVPPPDTPRN
jgi:hypothetical protein